MASNMNTKVRLVRCPKCRKVLPELPEVSLYRCGGCGAVLQAKKAKNVETDATSNTREEDSLGKQKVEQSSDDKEAGSSSSQQFPVLSTEQTDRNSDHNEPRSSTELSSHEDLGSSPEARAHINIDEENHPIDQYDRTDQDQNEEMVITNEISENGEGGIRSGESSREFAANVKEKCSSSELTSHEVEQPSEAAPANAEVIEDSSTSLKSNFKSLIAEKLLDIRPRKVASATVQSRLDEEDALSEDETADLSHHRSVRGFERISSVETLENVPFSNTSYYGYEGSVSSFDGNDDQVLDSQSGKNRVVGSKELSKRDGRQTYNIPSGDLVYRHRDKRHHGSHPSMKNGRQDKDTMMRLEKGKQRSASVQSVYGNASPSRLGFNEFHDKFRYHSPAIAENPKLEKLELLKMVRELQDQLDRTTVSNAQQVPSYHNHLGVQREGYQVPNFPRYPGRHGQRMAFSGEAALDRNQVDCPCHRCLPQQRHYSAQLPPQVICYNTGYYGPQYVPTPYYSPRYSGPSSPQHHSGSEFSAWAHETKSNDPRRRNDISKSKRHSPKKRHVRPIAGGAPVISCYGCSELLQLPQNFLLFKRRYHSLRCSACSKVLKFSLVNRTHVIRYYPEETIAAPPSSEVEDYAESSRMRAASRGEPVSCSDRSFQKSYSTETDRHSLAVPFRTFDRNSTERKMSSRSSYEPIEEKPKLEDPQNRYNDVVPESYSPGPSSKMSKGKKVVSEIEEIQPASSGSPLHRLMGYASPSKVIRG